MIYDLEAIQRVRRGHRIAHCVPLVIHWREPRGVWREIPAQTKILSAHGCLLDCAARIKLCDEVMVWWVEKNRCARARVVFRKLGGVDEPTEIALEFLDDQNFWDVDFAQPHALNMACPTVIE
jgi:hypothetical protein